MSFWQNGLAAESSLSQEEVDSEWDRLEGRMGPAEKYVGSFGRQSEFLWAAVRNKLIAFDKALELYLVAIGLRIVVR